MPPDPPNRVSGGSRGWPPGPLEAAPRPARSHGSLPTTAGLVPNGAPLRGSPWRELAARKENPPLSPVLSPCSSRAPVFVFDGVEVGGVCRQSATVSVSMSDPQSNKQKTAICVTLNPACENMPPCLSPAAASPPTGEPAPGSARSPASRLLSGVQGCGV